MRRSVAGIPSPLSALLRPPPSPLLLLLLLLLLFLVQPRPGASSEDGVFADDAEADRYFFACSGARTEVVAEMLASHRDPGALANARTKDGETCLHLTSIEGAGEIAALLLREGADPNVRNLYERGQRMTPLAWNVYAGHAGIVRSLLDGGADVNADFDLFPDGHPGQRLATVVDVAEELSRQEEEGGGEGRFARTLELLVERGGRQWEAAGREL